MQIKLKLKENVYYFKNNFIRYSLIHIIIKPLMIMWTCQKQKPKKYSKYNDLCDVLISFFFLFYFFFESICSCLCLCLSYINHKLPFDMTCNNFIKFYLYCKLMHNKTTEIETQTDSDIKSSRLTNDRHHHHIVKRNERKKTTNWGRYIA